jgi:dTDP-4-dehydrorhamnose 3,5-epimerase
VIFRQTALEGAFLITPERLEDERGFFALAWDRGEFEKHGLRSHLAEINISFNYKRGTLRGMHYQAAPYAQPKLVRCTMGAIYDVIIDLRAGSSGFKRWLAVELTQENRQMLFIPEGFAHGFQTLCDSTEVVYQAGEVYAPHAARGVRWNDPAFAIEWPLPVSVIAERDASYPDCAL